MPRKRKRPTKADLDEPVSIDIGDKTPEEALRDLLNAKVQRDNPDKDRDS